MRLSGRRFRTSLPHPCRRAFLLETVRIGQTFLLIGDGDEKELTPEDASRYLRWIITEKGARITDCDRTFEGAMEIPSALDGVPVVEIGAWAFLGRDLLKRIVIPDSVEIVGKTAFASCRGLQELRLGTGIKKIEKSAFCNCSSLKSVAIPDSVEAVGATAFASCYGLKELRLGTGIKKIENASFLGCGSLSSVVIPDTVEVVGEFAFATCLSLETLRLGAEVKKIEKAAFRGCFSLHKVVLPSTLEELARDAFDESVDLVVDGDI